MIKKIALLILLSSIIKIANSQSLYFCTKVSSAGVSGDPANYWIMKKTGGTLTVVYKQDSTIHDSLYARVLKKKDEEKGVYYGVSDRAMPFAKGRKFQVTAYDFQETGVYLVSVYNKSKTLVNANVTIALAGEQKIPLTTYKKAKMTFFSKMNDSIPEDTGSTFNIRGSKGGNIKGYISNNKPMLSSIMYVQILRKSLNDYYGVDYFNFKADPDKKTVIFDIPIKDAGNYEIVVRNEENILIKAAPIKIFMTEVVKDKKE